MQQEVLLVIGVILVLIGLLGKLNSKYFDVGTSNRQVRIVIGLLGAFFLVFYFAEPSIFWKQVVSMWSPTRTRNLVLRVDKFDVHDQSEEADIIALKAERDLVELFAMNNLEIRSDLTHEGPSKENYKVYRLNGAVSSNKDSLSIAVKLNSPDSFLVASASMEVPIEEVLRLKGEIAKTLAYGLDIELSNLTQKKTKKTNKRPTESLNAFLWYQHAIQKIRESRTTDAIDSLKRATDLDPKFAMAYWTGAKLLEENKQTEEAAIWEAIAASINPDHPHWAYRDRKEFGNPLPELFEAILQSNQSSEYEGMRFLVARSKEYGIEVAAWWIDPRQFEISIRKHSNAKGDTVEEYFNSPEDILAINGGFFNIDEKRRLSPAGLLVIGGVQSQPLLEALSGAFVVKNGRPDIIWARDLGDSKLYDYAVQGGPIIVEPGGKLGIYSNDHNRRNRTGLCLTKKHLVFITVIGDKGQGLSLYEFAEILRSDETHGGFECQKGLNLDGGASTQVTFRYQKDEYLSKGLWKVPNAILVSLKGQSENRN